MLCVSPNGGIGHITRDGFHHNFRGVTVKVGEPDLTCLSYSESGRLAVVGSASGSLLVIDTDEGTRVRVGLKATAHARECQAIDWARHGKIAAGFEKDARECSVVVWDGGGGAEPRGVLSGAPGDSVFSLAWVPESDSQLAFGTAR